MFSGYPALFLSSQLSFAEEVRLREVIQKNGGKVSNERQGAVLVIDDFNKVRVLVPPPDFMHPLPLT